MSFQTHKTFIHLQKTNEDILMKSESFLTLHRQRGCYHVQGRERYKEHRQNSPCDIRGSTIILWNNESTLVPLLSMQGQKALRFCKKYRKLCSKDERRSYMFGRTLGWVITDRIFIFGRTIPLKTCTSVHLIDEFSSTTFRWWQQEDNKRKLFLNDKHYNVNLLTFSSANNNLKMLGRDTLSWLLFLKLCVVCYAHLVSLFCI